MAFISEALPGVVFLVRLWICKFSFQGSPAAHDLHLETAGRPRAAGWEGHNLTQMETNLPASGSRTSCSNWRCPRDPGNLNILMFVQDEREKQERSSEKTIWFSSCVYTFETGGGSKPSVSFWFKYRPSRRKLKLSLAPLRRGLVESIECDESLTFLFRTLSISVVGCWMPWGLLMAHPRGERIGWKSRRFGASMNFIAFWSLTNDLFRAFPAL